MLLKIVNKETQKILCDQITSYEEAWDTLSQMCNYNSYEVIEYKIPVSGYGRDPDLH